MLKHEEMIENVHRRIAQYEEEQKMKHSKLKNIFSALKFNKKDENIKLNEDGFYDVVSGSEKIKPSNHILRAVSAAAVFTLLVAGLGTTGWMLLKNKPHFSELPENETVITETTNSTNSTNSTHSTRPTRSTNSTSSTDSTKVSKTTKATETTEATQTTKTTESTGTTEATKTTQTTQTTKSTETLKKDTVELSQLVDFNQIPFRLINLSGDFEDCNYSNETHNRLAMYLNSFNWGKGTNIPEYNVPDIYSGDYKGYAINWRKGVRYFSVVVMVNGKAYYKEEQCVPDGNWCHYPIVESKIFNIDYEIFSINIQDILRQDIPDPDGKLSEREIKELSNGEFLSAELEVYIDGYCDELNPTSEHAKTALNNFLKNDFLTMLRKKAPNNFGSGDDDTEYYLTLYYKSSDTTTSRGWYYITSKGKVSLCSYELLGNDDIPTGTEEFYIDMEDFKNKLNEILNK